MLTVGGSLAELACEKNTTVMQGKFLACEWISHGTPGMNKYSFLERSKNEWRHPCVFVLGISLVIRVGWC